MSKRSVIWRYFSKHDNTGEACCNECHRKIKCLGNTTNLFAHLKKTHPRAYRHAEAQRVEANRQDFMTDMTTAPDPVTLTDDESQSSLGTSYITTSDSQENVQSVLDANSQASTSKDMTQTKMDTFIINKQCKKKYDKALAYCIATDMLPYCFVEKSGFNHFLQVCLPGYQPPSRKTITERLIPGIYEICVDNIKKMLNGTPYLALTTDSWQSAAVKDFMSLTAHFVDNWTMKSACLNCAEINLDHTSENLAALMTHLLEYWNIQRTQLVAVTTDSGRNFVKMVELLNYGHISCSGHAFNTGVTKALETQHLKTIMDKLKKLQNSYSHSSKMDRQLNSLQKQFNLPERKIPSYSKTRWWSLLKLMEFFVEQHTILFHLFPKQLDMLPTPCEIGTLKECLEVLKMLQDISDKLAAENYITASAIRPIFWQLKKYTDELGEETQIDSYNTCYKTAIMDEVLRVFQDRYSKHEKTKQLLQICTTLDPRFKLNFEDETEYEHIKEKITEEMQLLENSPDVETAAVKRKKSTGLSAIFKNKDVNYTFQEIDVKTRCSFELDNYLQIPTIDIDDSPLEWWRHNEKIFPKLAVVAKKYFCIQATSVPSERVFSKGGLVVTDNRTSLTGEHCEELIFLSLNKSIIHE